MKISIIGTGYVGLVTGACLANHHQVTCLDNDLEKIALLKKGISPIYEPGIDKLIKKNLNRNLFFSEDIIGNIKKSEVIFIAVGTPEARDGSVDLATLYRLVDMIASHLEKNTLIINKTTAPVGTGLIIKKRIAKKTKSHFAIVSNPEFLREGVAINDFLYPERVILGVEDSKSFKKAQSIYLPLVSKNKIIKMDINSAELSKYAANAMLATRISLMNELAIYAEKVKANIEEVKKGIGLDQRIGKDFLNAGIGYGGSCFPKDVNGLLHHAKSKKVKLNVISGTKETNQRQINFFLKKIKKYFGENISRKKVAIWGITFKPDTDDLREAPALLLIKKLLDLQVKINVSDPQGLIQVKKVYGNKIDYYENPYQALEKANALILCTEWGVYKKPDVSKMIKLMKEKVIFDGRNLLKDFAKKNKFAYFGIGNG